MLWIRIQEKPKQKRKPPTDLSGLTDEEKVKRRKEHARTYSRQSRQRHKEMRDELAEELDALAFVRDLFELAPHVYIVLSPDVVCTTILYANQATKSMLHFDPSELLDR